MYTFKDIKCKLDNFYSHFDSLRILYPLKLENVSYSVLMNGFTCYEFEHICLWCHAKVFKLPFGSSKEK